MPKINCEDTIAALSTPPGEGGMAVIRVSGKEAVPLAAGVFRSTKNGRLTEQPTHTVHHGHIVDEKGSVVDEVLMSLFRAPHSYTGEDVVEVGCHGGMRLVRRILEILFARGARPAEPGEFTKRAFLHGKLDLTQVEAVLDLIRARSEASLETAIGQLQGGLSKKIRHLKDALMKVYAHLEASLDFPEEHLEVFPRAQCLERLEEVLGEIRTLIAGFKRGTVLREGILTVLVGRPNVGKSSLFNALLERDRALVSEIPGTTRDALEEGIEIGGIGLRLVDTAGLGSGAPGPLDQMGRERTKRYLREGDFFLFLVDHSSEWTKGEEEIFKEIGEKDFLLVVNKADLPRRLDLEKLNARLRGRTPALISCATGAGLPELEKRIEEEISRRGVIQESPVLTRLRHKRSLEEAGEALGRSRKGLEEGLSVEWVLEDLRRALDSLKELIGEIYSDDLLDVVFQEFCIGK